MSFQANVLKVMIASPEDVAEERKIVTEAIHRWNDTNASARQIVLLPVKWETHSTPQLGAPAQTVINRQLLDDADIMIGIFGRRIGTPTEEYISGTVEEIKKHVAAGKTAKVYFSEVQVSLETLDLKQYAAVQAFREELRSTGLYATYKTIQQFKEDFGNHLALELNQPRYIWLTVLEPVERGDDGSLSEDALRLLRAVANDDGQLIFQDDFGLRIGDEDFTDGTHRSVAHWKAVREELVNHGALEYRSGSMYQMTARGYDDLDRADKAKADAKPKATPFDEFQKTHTHEMLESLGYMQRDLLRFLLLKGGTARGDVLFNARTNKQGFDVNGLCRPLIEKGLLTQTEDRINGYSTYSVNEPLTGVLKGTLFPRNEQNDSPFFEGIQPPVRPS